MSKYLVQVLSSLKLVALCLVVIKYTVISILYHDRIDTEYPEMDMLNFN